MEEGRQKDLQLLEEIIDKSLKQKLLQTIASRYLKVTSFFQNLDLWMMLKSVCM